MSLRGETNYGPPDSAIIREIYDSEHAHETFGEELERALEAGCQTIIIEPSRLGDETARWIAVGNCLHKTAVVAGLGSIAAGIAWADWPTLYMPLAITSLFCTGLYTVSWQFDPCCQYQVSRDAHSFTSHLLATSLTTSSPVVTVIVVAGLVWADRPTLYMPLAITSLFCTGLYTVSWQFDPCCQYQVSRDAHSLTSHPLATSLTTSSPVVLVRTNDYHRKLLHSVVTLASSVLCAWKFYLTCTK